MHYTIITLLPSLNLSSIGTNAIDAYLEVQYTKSTFVALKYKI
jgi:hypothetical protein